MRYNILWGILHGGTVTPADWVRGSSEKYGREGRDDSVRTVLPEVDDSVRGWMTETLVQLALRSSRRDAILGKDPANTYAESLTPTTPRLFTTRSNIGGGQPLMTVMVREPSDTGAYLRVARFTPAGALPDTSDPLDGDYTFSVTPPGETSRTMTLSFDDGSAELPFSDGVVQVFGVTNDWFGRNSLDVSYKALPRRSHVAILSDRLGEDIVEEAGLFCLETLGRHA